VRALVALLVFCAGTAFAQTASLTDLMPANQLRIVNIINDYAQRYKAADNELKKSSVWKARTKAIDEALKRRPGEKPVDWVGVVEKMGTTGDGKAWVVMRISPIATISTWNNDFSDIGDRTLIKNGSPVYKALENLKPGAVVRFDCQLKTSGQALIEANRLQQPDFLARFKSITPIPGASRKM
jgi:hypothetical protein